MNSKSLSIATLGTVVALTSLTGVSTVRAVNYAEPGDAGQTLATAANTALTAGGSGAGALTGISGTIGTSGDADLYRFTVTAANPIFSATAVGGTSSVAGNGAIDTSLFLFDVSGNPLFANDDQSNGNYQGSLLTLTLAPGTYYLGISLSGNEPVNSSNQLLFTTDQPTTNLRGAASGLNPTTESTFNGGTFIPETGPYSISVSAVPEPSTWALVGAGALVLGVVMMRRRQSVVA